MGVARRPGSGCCARGRFPGVDSLGRGVVGVRACVGPGRGRRVAVLGCPGVRRWGAVRGWVTALRGRRASLAAGPVGEPLGRCCPAVGCAGGVRVGGWPGVLLVPMSRPGRPSVRRVPLPGPEVCFTVPDAG